MKYIAFAWLVCFGVVPPFLGSDVYASTNLVAEVEVVPFFDSSISVVSVDLEGLPHTPDSSFVDKDGILSF